MMRTLFNISLILSLGGAMLFYVESPDSAADVWSFALERPALSHGKPQAGAAVNIPQPGLFMQ